MFVVSQRFNGDTTLMAPGGDRNKWRRYFAAPKPNEGDLVDLSVEEQRWQQTPEIGMPSPFLGEGQSPEDIQLQIESAEQSINALRIHIERLEQELRRKRHGEV